MPGTTAESPAIDPRRSRVSAALAGEPRRGRVLAALAAVVVIAGVVLRFAAQSAMWLDEALTVHIAELDIDRIDDALRRDGHPPLYYIVLHFWMKLFGDGDSAVRALSGLISVATLPLAYLLGRRLAGRVAGWTAVLVLASSPFAVRYATENRMYALLGLLAIALWLLVLRVLDEPRPGRLVAVGLLAGALLWTHYWGVFLLGGITAVVVAERWLAGRPRDSIAPVGAMFVGSLLFVPWVPSLLTQLRDTGTPWATPRNPFAATALTLSDLAGGTTRSESVPLAAVMVFGIVLALFAVTRTGHRVELDFGRRDDTLPTFGVVAISLGAGVALAWLSGTAYESRYAAIVAPLVAVLVGVGLSRLPAGAVRIVAVAGVCALGLVGGIRSDREDRTQAREVADAIEQRAAPGDLVVSCPDQLGPGVMRELGDRFEVVAYPRLEPAVFVDWVDYGERHAGTDPDQVAEQLVARADGDIWIVWRGGYRTLDEQCERLIAALNVRSDAIERIVNDRQVFEPAILDRAVRS